jgi:uncharacterized protein
MNNPKQNFYLTKNNHKIHFKFIKGKKPITVIFLHGLMSSIQSKKVKYLKKFALKNKINILMFEYRGHGKSSGRFSDFSIKDWIYDSKLIIEKLVKTKKIILIGSSMGSWIAINLIKFFKNRIIGLIGIAAAPDFTEELIWPKLTKKAKKIINKNKIYKLKSNYNNYYPITKKFINDAKQFLVLKKKFICNFPVELFHGYYDASVPWIYAIKLKKVLISKQFKIHLIKTGNHSLSKPEDLQKIGLRISKMIKNTF